MKKTFLVVLVSLLSVVLYGQSTLKGVIRVAGTNEPASHVTVTLNGVSSSVTTNSQGEFQLNNLSEGNDLLVISQDGVILQQLVVSVNKQGVIDLGNIPINMVPVDMTKEDQILSLSENDLDIDGGSSRSQNVSGLLSSRGDVFNSTAGYVFGSMRFRQRGYSSIYNTTYLNGINLDNAERGGFYYGSIGGLNDMVRSKESLIGVEASSFAYGNLGSTTQIDARASMIRKGLKIGQVASNRSYTTRTMITYGTGLMDNGWAVAASASYRWGKEGGFAQGTFYDAWAYALSIEKRITDQHSLSLITLGAPTERGQQGAATQEAYDLTPKRSIFNTTLTRNGNSIYGNNYYNPNWGYQNGVMRNARQVRTFVPTTVLSYIWKINDMSKLTTSVGYKYQDDGRTSLNWYKSADPRPDYYRNLPNYYMTLSPANTEAANIREFMWMTDENYRQVDWDAMYRANALANITDKSGRYIVENRKNNQHVASFNSVLNYNFNENWQLDAGIEYQYTKGMHYKVIDDLLGAEYWLDIDQYGERDNPGDTKFMQNNLLDPNRHVVEGDIFGYNYDIHVNKANAWAQGKYRGTSFDVYLAANVEYNSFYRVGHMKNGRASDSLYLAQTFNGNAKKWEYVDGSYGSSPVQNFLTYGVKIGANYRITGRHIIAINIANGTNAPLANDAYFSPRVKANLIPDLRPENYLAVDLNYYFRTRYVNGRLTLYNTNFWNSTELSSFYNDEFNTYVNFAMYDFNKRHTGAELGLEVKVSSAVTLVGVAAFGQNVYTSDPTATISMENGLYGDVVDKIYVKGFHLDGTPEVAATVGVKYFHPKYWFLELNVNYFTNSYLDFNPLRRTEGAIAGLNPENEADAKLIADIRDQERLKGGFTVDASIGKSFRFNYKYFLNINLSANNILNNTNLRTGGYEQSRFSSTNSSTSRETYLKRFPNKYFYAYGTTFFLNVSFRF